jgi:hypothetical protein
MARRATSGEGPLPASPVVGRGAGSYIYILCECVRGTDRGTGTSGYTVLLRHKVSRFPPAFTFQISRGPHPDPRIRIPMTLWLSIRHPQAT